MSGSNSSARAGQGSGLVAEPLGMTVHDVAAPDLADPDAVERGRTRRGRLRMLLVLLVCAAPVIASYFTYFVIRPEGRTNYGELILPTRGLPALALRTLDGAEVPAAALRGQWLLVVVGSSACDERCEQRLYMQRQLREMLGRERDRLDKIWFITDGCLLYTSDAADERSSVDLGGRRIIKKKKRMRQRSSAQWHLIKRHPSIRLA